MLYVITIYIKKNELNFEYLKWAVFRTAAFACNLIARL